MGVQSFCFSTNIGQVLETKRTTQKFTLFVPKQRNSSKYGQKVVSLPVDTVKQTSLCSFPCLFKVSTNCSMISCTSFKSFSYLEFIFINDVIISSRPFAALSKMGLAVSWDSGKWCRLSLYSSRFLSQTYQYIYEYNIVLPICANTCGARLVQIECCSWHGHKPSYWR